MPGEETGCDWCTGSRVCAWSMGELFDLQTARGPEAVDGHGGCPSTETNLARPRLPRVFPEIRKTLLLPE